MITTCSTISARLSSHGGKSASSMDKQEAFGRLSTQGARHWLRLRSSGTGGEAVDGKSEAVDGGVRRSLITVPGN